MRDTVDRDAILDFERRQPFWPQLGFGVRGPDFGGQKVLEVGSGCGERCLDIAVRGARRVVGVDPSSDSVATARKNLAQHPALADVVEYRLGILHDLTEGDFDAAISENTLEHVLDVPELLAAVRERLRPGGRLYVGFGPLYHSPFGDHGWMREALPLGRWLPLPWGHVLAPHGWLLRRMQRYYGLPVHSTADWPFLPLNRLAVSDFRRLFRESGLRTAYGRANVNYGWKGRLVGLVGRLPLLDKYFTLNLFYILERPV